MHTFCYLLAIVYSNQSLDETVVTVNMIAIRLNANLINLNHDKH
jgi:hypothetical protein